MKYELEKCRRYESYAGVDTFLTIGQCETRELLLEQAQSLKLRTGRTFWEILYLHELDEHGDIVDSEILKETR